MKNKLIAPLKALALATVVFGLVFTTACNEDEDPDCVESTFYADTDGDGLGDVNSSVMACEQPEGFVENSDDDESDGSVDLYTLIGNTDGLDSLKKYLDVYPDLVATLQASGSFTLFAPDNDAFVGLLATPGFPQNITSINPDIIKNVLAYHISTQQYLAADLSAGTEVATLATANNADDKVVVNDNGTLLTGSSNAEIEISNRDLKATNGVMHVVASVLIPQSVGATLTPILGTNAGTLLLGADFSLLAQAILKADTFATTAQLPTLVSILSGEAVHTVFAPSNGTFEAGSLTAASFSGQQWYGIIANHVVMDEVEPSELPNADATTPVTLMTAASSEAQVQQLTFYYLDGQGNFTNIMIDSNQDVDPTDVSTFANLDGEVALPDAQVNANGRVHVVAGVLSPKQ